VNWVSVMNFTATKRVFISGLAGEGGPAHSPPPGSITADCHSSVAISDLRR